MTVIYVDEVINNNGIWHCYANEEGSYHQREIYSKYILVYDISVNNSCLW